MPKIRILHHSEHYKKIGWSFNSPFSLSVFIGMAFTSSMLACRHLYSPSL